LPSRREGNHQVLEGGQVLLEVGLDEPVGELVSHPLARGEDHLLLDGDHLRVDDAQGQWHVVDSVYLDGFCACQSRLGAGQEAEGAEGAAAPDPFLGHLSRRALLTRPSSHDDGREQGLGRVERAAQVEFRFISPGEILHFPMLWTAEAERAIPVLAANRFHLTVLLHVSSLYRMFIWLVILLV